jgi:hypothetical protein
VPRFVDAPHFVGVIQHRGPLASCSYGRFSFVVLLTPRLESLGYRDGLLPWALLVRRA